MAALSPFSTPLRSISVPNFRKFRVSPAPNSSVQFQNKSSCVISLNPQKRTSSHGMRRLKSFELETFVGELGTEAAPAAQEEPVSVTASPSDSLTMHFQADGILNESEIARVTKALEEYGGISNLKVNAIEGIGTVELTKQTTVQATGIASGLVEVIQGAGFKLQTLNLSFDDEEDILA